MRRLLPVAAGLVFGVSLAMNANAGEVSDQVQQVDQRIASILEEVSQPTDDATEWADLLGDIDGPPVASGLLIPAFGYENHINVDRRHRLIRRREVTHAAAHDGAQLPKLLNRAAFDSRVWADSAYCSAANERAIAVAGRRSMVHFRKPKGRPMSGPYRRTNRARSRVRSAVGHVFAEQKARTGLYVRTVGIARARIKIGWSSSPTTCAALFWLEARYATA